MHQKKKNKIQKNISIFLMKAIQNKAKLNSRKDLIFKYQIFKSFNPLNKINL